MLIDKQTRTIMLDILDSTVNEVEQEIIDKLRIKTNDRQQLLAELDVVTAIREELYARLNKRDPINRSD